MDTSLTESRSLARIAALEREVARLTEERR